MQNEGNWKSEKTSISARRQNNIFRGYLICVRSAKPGQSHRTREISRFFRIRTAKKTRFSNAIVEKNSPRIQLSVPELWTRPFSYWLGICPTPPGLPSIDFCLLFFPLPILDIDWLSVVSWTRLTSCLAKGLAHLLPIVQNKGSLCIAKYLRFLQLPFSNIKYGPL